MEWRQVPDKSESSYDRSRTQETSVTMPEVTVKWRGKKLSVPVDEEEEPLENVISRLSDLTGVPQSGIRLMGGRGIVGKGSERKVLAGANVMMTGTTSDEVQRVQQIAEEAKAEITVVDDLAETALLTERPAPATRSNRLPARQRLVHLFGDLDGDEEQFDEDPGLRQVGHEPIAETRRGILGLEDIEDRLSAGQATMGSLFRQMDGVTQSVVWMDDERFTEATRVAKRKRKLLCVILTATEPAPATDDGSGSYDPRWSQESSELLSTTLQEALLASYLQEHFLAWGADLSEMARSPEVDSFLEGLGLHALPVCLVVGHLAGSPVIMDLFAFTAVDSPRAVLDRLETVHTNFLAVSGGPDLTNNPAVDSAQALRDEQDMAYEESLAADRARAEAELREAAEEREQQRHLAELERARERAQASLPDEPAAGSVGTLLVGLRLPNGERAKRRFASSEPVEVVFLWCTAEGCGAPEAFNVVTDFPRRVFTLEADGNVSLGDAIASLGQSSASMLLQVEPRPLPVEESVSQP